MSINAFLVDGQDVDSYAFRGYPPHSDGQQLHQELVPDLSGESSARVRRCPDCDELLAKWEEPLLDLIVKKRLYDVGITYDGVMVVSGRFKSACEGNGLTGLIFRQLPKDPSFFAVGATTVVHFDADRRKTRFVKACPICGHFESVVGATPVYLKHGSQIREHEFVRTDLEFGSGDEKHPLLLCGKAAADILSKASLRGLDLEPVEEPI